MRQSGKPNPCFICGRTISESSSGKYWIDTHDNQIAEVGADCYLKVKKAGPRGFKMDALTLTIAEREKGEEQG